MNKSLTPPCQESDVGCAKVHSPESETGCLHVLEEEKRELIALSKQEGMRMNEHEGTTGGETRIEVPMTVPLWIESKIKIDTLSCSRIPKTSYQNLALLGEWKKRYDKKSNCILNR